MLLRRLALSVTLFISSVRAVYLNTTDPSLSNGNSSNSNYTVASYFVNWGIYGRNYQPANLSASQLTHVLYAFANLQPDGTVILSDTYADLEKHYANDSWNDVGNNVYGCIKQLYLLKKQNRNMKTLLSIGGWTFSTNFAAAASTNATRATFASTAVTFVKDLGFDGIDIDWEYPASDTEAANYVLLLAAIRSALDEYAAKNAPSYKFLLTIASPAGPTNYNKMQLSAMDPYLDAWNLMAYDYAGSWANMTGYLANLYPCSDNPDATPFSTDKAIQDYKAAGVTPGKISMGMPIYGRAFMQTTGIGKAYNGIGPGNWTQAGVYDYKSLPLAGATMTYDDTLGGAYSWDPAGGQLVSFDTVPVVQQKLAYIQSQGLGGAMFWEASADGAGDTSLIAAASQGLGAAGGLAQSLNWLDYPTSQYANLAAGMP